MKDISISAKLRSSLFKSPITAEAADYIDAQAARISELHAALATARKDALREAADAVLTVEVGDTFSPKIRCQGSILALINKDQKP